MFLFWVLTFSSYLIGSLSSAILICRLCTLPDPRTVGSKNPGATNVARVGGKKIAVFVFLGDCVKGVIAVLLARFFVPESAWGWIGLAVVIGHLFPIFFQFKGGKGVSTGAGVLIMLCWPVGLMVMAVWLIIAAVFRYSSLAAVGAVIAGIVFTLHWMPVQLIPVLIMSTLILYKHRGNIQRLINGRESKL